MSGCMTSFLGQSQTVPELTSKLNANWQEITTDAVTQHTLKHTMYASCAIFSMSSTELKHTSKVEKMSAKAY